MRNQSKLARQGKVESLGRGSGMVSRLKILVAVLPVLAGTGLGLAQEAAGGAPGVAAAVAGEGKSYAVGRFEIAYARPVQGLPPASQLLDLEVTLAQTPGGLVAPRADSGSIRFRLGSAPAEGVYYRSALGAINAQISKYLKDKGIEGAFVSPDAKDIDPESGQDLRGGRGNALRLVVLVSQGTVAPAAVSGSAAGAAKAISAAPTPAPSAPAAAPVQTISAPAAPPAQPPKAPAPSVAAAAPAPAVGAPATTPAQPAKVPATTPAASAAAPEAGAAFPVSRFDVSYARSPEGPGVPDLAGVKTLKVQLGKTEAGYVGSERATEQVTIALDNPPSDRPYYPSAIAAIDKAILDYFHRQGLVGVYVAPHFEDVDLEQARDLRKGTTVMRLVVLVGRVKEMRTVATSPRIPTTQRINHPRFEPILKNSPIQPGAGGKDVLNKKALDEYVLRLNRMPYRRVDVALAAAEQTQEAGGVALDYLISEVKPWTVYGQLSNTGTEQTSDWRERVGFVHNDLTKRDDILSLDFVTASLDQSNAVTGVYDAPLFGMQKLRWRAVGTWSEYTASDVGQPGADFSGEEWSFGGELRANIFQHRELFLDLVGGVTFKHIEADNAASNISGEAEYVLPTIGLQLERLTQKAATTAGLGAVFGLNAEADSSTQGGGDLAGLGRQDADEDFTLIQAYVTQSLYLEPLVNRNYTRLAHELFASGRVQYAFDDRLIPQEQETAGGFYSVRGYPESVVAGDTVWVGTLEYRYHFPRSLPIPTNPERTNRLFGRPFRFAPEEPFGRPDWDLILRAFVDGARVIQNDKQVFETDETLVGAGVGVEFQFKQNLNIRLDYGWALRSIGEDQAGNNDSGEVDSGESRAHFSLTVLY